MKFSYLVWTLILLTTACREEQATLPVDRQGLVTYQAAPLQEPKGGDLFKGSNFIHPLKTPAGFTVTDFQPDDHLHHFGLWWPWKYIEVEGRKILCWELQQQDGLVQAQGASSIDHGLLTRSVYLDRKAPAGPVARLKETARLTVSEMIQLPVSGYFLDLEIVHEVAGAQLVTISKYRYSGLGFRGTAIWNKDNSTLLTSEGCDRSSANSTRARWIRAEGATDSGAMAGILLMGHPENFEYPEKLRTWNQQHQGAIFINFNPVMDQFRVLKPGDKDVRRYRLLVYDGSLSPAAAETLWQEYTAL